MYKGAIELKHNEQLYIFPKNITELKTNNLMEKSILDNHNYIYDLVKKNKFKPISDVIY